MWKPTLRHFHNRLWRLIVHRNKYNIYIYISVSNGTRSIMVNSVCSIPLTTQHKDTDMTLKLHQFFKFFILGCRCYCCLLFFYSPFILFRLTLFLKTTIVFQQAQNLMHRRPLFNFGCYSFSLVDRRLTIPFERRKCATKWQLLHTMWRYTFFMVTFEAFCSFDWTGICIVGP